jgi:hypothetical protein
MTPSKCLERSCVGLILAQWILFERYIYLNLEAVGEGGKAPWLLVVCITMGLVIGWVRYRADLYKIISLALYLLIVYIAYFSFRCAQDGVPLNALSAYLLGTDSGMLLFGMLGISFALSTRYVVADLPKWYGIGFAMVIAIAVLVTWDTAMLALDFYARRTANSFSISGINGLYQRPGDFFVIRVFSLFFLIGWIAFVKTSNQLFAEKIIKKVLYFLLLLNTASSIFLSQALGANKATLLISIFFLVALYFVVVNVIFDAGSKGGGESIYFRPIDFKRMALKSFVWFLGIGIVAGAFIILIANKLNLSIAMFRIFSNGFDRSLAPRIDLIRDNFSIHFLYSPIFGNAKVEQITTGAGTYMHSIFLYPLTHTGVFGFLLFISAITFGVVKLFQSHMKYADNSRVNLNHLRLFEFFLGLMFLAVLLIGVVSATIHWAPFWFAAGYCFSRVMPGKVV